MYPILETRGFIRQQNIRQGSLPFDVRRKKDAFTEVSINKAVIYFHSRIRN